MSGREDILVFIRGILKRPVESLLLILGIALGIGAAASGISIVVQTMGESAKLLSETRYREIVVKTRESAAEMQQPAEQSRTGNDVFLTANDLSAKKDIPAVQYAYVANRSQIDFRDFRNMERDFQQMRGPTGAAGNNPAQVQPGAGDVVVIGDNPPPGGDNPGPGGAMFFNGGPGGNNGGNRSRATPVPTIEGPKPVIEEIVGYEVSPEYFDAYGITAAQGSLFTADDIKKRQPIMILGSEIAKTLFEDGIALDRQILMHREIVKIVGILKPTGTDLDKAGFMPIVVPDETGTDFRLRMQGWNTNLRFTVKDAAKLNEAKAQLVSYFDSLYGEGSVALSVPREEAEELANRNTRLVTIIMILAVSGLLIASVNVSNILYSRGLRKRKSIGILKAMGATRNHIFTLFFIEALIIGASGAVFGTGIAILLSGLMKTSLGIGGYSIGILGLGVLLSLATTLFLTNVPAMQTSKISASDAIRYE